MSRNLILGACVPTVIALAAWVLMGIGLPTAQPAGAASATTVTLQAIQDTYTDINLPATNMDQDLLNAANSSGPPGESDVTTKKIFLTFDLSSVNKPIKSATLRLSTLTCDGLVPVDEADISVYGLNNDVDWSEETLTWSSQPHPSTDVLVSLDAGKTTFDTAQTYTWTDDDQGALAAWLETQRGMNSQRATLILAIDHGEPLGIADIFFEDREGTGAAYGCTDSLGGPVLQVSDTIGSFSLNLPLIKK